MRQVIAAFVWGFTLGACSTKPVAMPLRPSLLECPTTIEHSTICIALENNVTGERDYDCVRFTIERTTKTCP